MTMNCPKCLGPMRCIETRFQDPDVKRRHKCKNDLCAAYITTIEQIVIVNDGPLLPWAQKEKYNEMKLGREDSVRIREKLAKIMAIVNE